jgi:hypothetical protein
MLAFLKRPERGAALAILQDQYAVAIEASYNRSGSPGPKGPFGNAKFVVQGLGDIRKPYSATYSRGKCLNKR